jgi:hypothetical protein
VVDVFAVYGRAEASGPPVSTLYRMSDLGSICARARRYKELKGKDVTWPVPT